MKASEVANRQDEALNLISNIMAIHNTTTGSIDGKIKGFGVSSLILRSLINIDSQGNKERLNRMQANLKNLAFRASNKENRQTLLLSAADSILTLKRYIQDPNKKIVLLPKLEKAHHEVKSQLEKLELEKENEAKPSPTTSIKDTSLGADKNRIHD